MNENDIIEKIQDYIENDNYNLYIGEISLKDLFDVLDLKISFYKDKLESFRRPKKRFGLFEDRIVVDSVSCGEFDEFGRVGIFLYVRKNKRSFIDIFRVDNENIVFDVYDEADVKLVYKYKHEIQDLLNSLHEIKDFFKLSNVATYEDKLFRSGIFFDSDLVFYYYIKLKDVKHTDLIDEVIELGSNEILSKMYVNIDDLPDVIKDVLNESLKNESFAFKKKL